MIFPLNSTVLGLMLALLSGSAMSQAIPKSGSLTLNTAYKGTGEIHQITDSRLYRAGTWLGISYNSAGSGLFHAGPVLCVGYLELVNGAGPSKGVCTFGDSANGIHGEFTGMVTTNAPYEGSGKFTAGTGTFAGVTGGWTFKCVPVNFNAGQWTCEQKVDYRLP